MARVSAVSTDSSPEVSDSDPARSTRWSLPVRSSARPVRSAPSAWPAAARESRFSVMTACERLERSFRLVEPTARAALPCAISARSSSREVTRVRNVCDPVSTVTGGRPRGCAISRSEMADCSLRTSAICAGRSRWPGCDDGASRSRKPSL